MSKAKLHSKMFVSLRALGRTEQVRRYTGGQYQDAVTIGDYKVEFDDDGRDFRALLWNPDRPCVVVSLDKVDTIAVIDSIEYDSRCTISGHMQRGKETRDMIDFMIELLRAHGATRTQLTDKTTIRCKDGHTVKLGLMYFIKYGMTWYEKYFRFHPVGDEVTTYENAKQKRLLMDIPFLQRQSCEYFAVHEKELSKQVGLDRLPYISWEKTLE